MAKVMYFLDGPKRTVILLCLLQMCLLIFFALLTTYGGNAIPKTVAQLRNTTSRANPDEETTRIYPMYQDVHVMIWVGFGFLMTFLRRYGQSGIGLTLLVAAILVQVAMLCHAVLDIAVHSTNRAPVTLLSLLNADVAVAAPLISMGALLGKTSYMQLITMGSFQLIVQTVNKYICEKHFWVIDSGESMYVHVFGAYFGLAVSWVLGRKIKPSTHPLEESSYQSDIFAMMGTVFLWIFWPSFNSATLEGDMQQRAIINTVLSISASCVTAFATSALVSINVKFNMVHVQNSTLAGGVAIGTAAGMMCEPFGALAIGMLAGASSVLGYRYLTPILQKHIGIHDTCGVHNLHGMPGILAALFGALLAGIASHENYDLGLYKIFPARAPMMGEELKIIRMDFLVMPGLNRSGSEQAGYQILALVLTLTMAIVSGAITGLVIKIPVFGSILEKQQFDDGFLWELTKEDESNVKPKKEVDNSLPMEQL